MSALRDFLEEMAALVALGLVVALIAAIYFGVNS